VDVPVNEVLAIITAPDESFSRDELSTRIAEPSADAESRVVASPAAKRLAREAGIELFAVKGTGPEGRTSEQDVQRFIEKSGQTVMRVKGVIPLTGLRKTSAQRVSESFRTAPHSTIMMEVNCSTAEGLRKKIHVSYTAIILRAVALTLSEHPIINSTLDADGIKLLEDVNVGVAVATENGLVVPVIRDAGKKSLQEIDAAIRELSQKAKEEKLVKEEVTAGTFTVTNLGMYGVDFFTPIINPPEAAILGIGKLVRKPIVIESKIEIHPMLMLCLSYDHRIVDGAPAADFLNDLKAKIENGIGIEA
jgi:pyruvate dehydrogenase E2 component (dihydrolipoamide acetyltransferase)